MKTKFMLISSIILFLVSILFLLTGNRTTWLVLFIIAMLLNLTRQLIDLKNKSKSN